MSGSDIRIVEMPTLGAVNDSSLVVGERAGSGLFTATALRSYVLDGTKLPTSATGLPIGAFWNNGGVVCVVT
jgi:hypothetical protein